ncbi:hypothetical protein [Clostridium lacusfryxellense]|uniref:hypothetical protein n=1 Tax=Clostridium lacusfryxellense TaxID=205328 RepID=UPI001C0B4009|nr:hypothetical protein [Clostridium lacusfryxellense]MBU3110145.1 hypothetical protein [Clostridium lacusfryxellense]
MKKIKLPKIIIIYTAFFGLFALVSGIWGIIDPMQKATSLNVTLNGSGLYTIFYFYSIRNFSFGVLFFLALFKYRTKEVFLTIYITRFINNVCDGIAIFSTGFDSINSIGLFTYIYIFILLIPIPFVIYYLDKKM